MKVTLEHFPKVTSILRGYTLDEVDTILEVLCESSIRSVEITYNTPNAGAIIRHAVEAYGDRLVVGAGTVTTMKALKEVIEAGVDFVLSPTIYTEEMLTYCKDHGVISVPGALSPSEVQEQFRWGADIVKVFPAVVAGPIFFKQLAGPMGHQPLMAVGGVNAQNAKEYLAAGADFLGIGSGMFSKTDVTEGNKEGLRESLRAFEAVVGL
ncbi:MAG: bifunctional 4-hydroxy-2-oxoglutarate aldolase/2-dehydro-3-deoxy-phosphogluconate aldolase [Lachnospiraceae bacterium]|nr:bifunctional 4-hydroxy-2-oxoglutarate aldolase/2-dehydro-3-deoxy-phosphogluconate aldolase [Lachnospiraceae bacterium]